MSVCVRTRAGACGMGVVHGVCGGLGGGGSADSKDYTLS